jgi:hypothetical protein
LTKGISLVYTEDMNNPEKIKRKYGADAFRRWGKLGGNELLIAQGQGAKITVHKRRRINKG